ncbi:hypothetical protein [Chitinophaga barathri]|uniref:Uncharacterized protein n=1 Tax=Chitinophaga barathri TaxID=1647451 RepID=A0A3N4MGH0_9BACT|nr:hypothetical protein [Chitinophaga barathri]RPD39190.1 hypothetical protein EG028_21500 [Chitinophaga barathri]
MNFSFHRFILLLKMQFAVNRRFYLLGIAALAGLLLVYMFFRAANGDFGFEFDAQEENYAFTMCFLTVVFGTMIFRQLGSKPQRIQALMLPVSALERMSVAFLMVFILFPIVYTLVYFLCSGLVNLVDVHVLSHPNEWYLLNGEMEIKALTILMLTLPVVLFCAVWFRRLTFVKTMVMLCVPLLVFSFFNSVLSKMVVNNAAPSAPKGVEYSYWASTPFSYLAVVVKTPNVESDPQSFNVLLPAGQQWVFTLFLCLIPFLFLYLAYLKLREQEL